MQASSFEPISYSATNSSKKSSFLVLRRTVHPSLSTSEASNHLFALDE